MEVFPKQKMHCCVNKMKTNEYIKISYVQKIWNELAQNIM